MRPGPGLDSDYWVGSRIANRAEGSAGQTSGPKKECPKYAIPVDEAIGSVGHYLSLGCGCFGSELESHQPHYAADLDPFRGSPVHEHHSGPAYSCTCGLLDLR